MPQGWVHQRLESGNAVVMIDGVDEVAEAKRDDVRAWVKELSDSFPDVRLIVTSRPHAVDEGWLEAGGFGEADLQPMGIGNIENFIDHWHEAVAEEVERNEQADRLKTLAGNLKETVRSNRSIRRLTTNPLLCAVICAFHRDTNEQLPEDRIELYEKCCSMLLERRDPESGLALTAYPRLKYRQKRALLDDLSYWMIKNEWTQVTAGSARDRLGKKLENLRTEAKDGPPATAENVLSFFVERSAMLRQPVEGKIDFAHRTFQEFMAAQAAVDEGDIGVLAKNATNPQWREVIVLGAGLARPHERRELITSLLKKGDDSEKGRLQLHLLAASGLDTAVDLDTTVKAEVENRVKKLVPPTKMQQAALLADAAGEIAIPFLKRDRRLSASKTAACVRALALIGSLEALQAIADYADDDRVTVLREIVRSGDRFETPDFARVVGSRLDATKLDIALIHEAFVRFGARGIRRLESAIPGSSLRLEGSSVKDLSGISGLTNLQSLHLGYTQVSDLSPLQGLTNLQSLDLHSTPVSDLSPLQGVTNLQSLDLHSTQVSNLSPLQGLTKLQSLDLGLTQVSDLSPLQGLTNLQSFTLQGSQVSDLSPLRGLTNLQSLTLWQTQVSDLSPLQGLPNLQSLYFEGTKVSNDQVKALHAANPKLKIRRW